MTPLRKSPLELAAAMTSHIQLFTPLTPSECVSRLVEVVDEERSLLFSWNAFFGSREVLGKVTQRSIRLRKRIKGRNSFQMFLIATMRPEEGGTEISGRISMHPFTRIFMIIWFSMAAILGLLTAIASLFHSSIEGRTISWQGILQPLIMLLFGYGLLRFGLWNRQEEASFLKEFLLRTLAAQDRLAPEE
jgi:hypothetical protein